MQLGVVAYPARLLVALQDEAGWQDEDPWQMSHVGRGKDHPLTLVNQVPKLLVQKLQVINAQLMCSPSKGVADLVL